MQGDIADEEFSQYFSQFGEIEDCVVSSFLFSCFQAQLSNLVCTVIDNEVFQLSFVHVPKPNPV
jgi:hypothetical protein